MTTADSVDDDFEEFWRLTAPDRKIDKKRARREYARARKVVGKDELHAAYARYWAETAARLTMYKKHPSTWLHGDCWEDAPQPIEFARSAADERFAAARGALAEAAMRRLH